MKFYYPRKPARPIGGSASSAGLIKLPYALRLLCATQRNKYQDTFHHPDLFALLKGHPSCKEGIIGAGLNQLKPVRPLGGPVLSAGFLNYATTW